MFSQLSIFSETCQTFVTWRCFALLLILVAPTSLVKKVREQRASKEVDGHRFQSYFLKKPTFQQIIMVIKECSH